MENNIIMSMKTKTQNYMSYALIAVGVAAILFLFGIPTLVACFKYDYSDEMSALIVGLISTWLGIDALQVAGGNFSKYTKSKFTYLEVTQETISGQINTKNFEIKVEDLVSASIQVCSVACDFDGAPKNMNPGLFMKLYAQTNKYLCLFTSTGKTYYIDCLTSPETAKNTIDAIIAKNMASRKETV